jgi:hypothetical protein
VPDEEKPPRYLTLKLPSGQVDGKFVSLQPGEKVSAAGYLADEPYRESLREFLRDARKNQLLDELPNADALRKVSLKRVGTRLDVTGLEALDSGAVQQNDVCIQGVVAKAWEAGQNLMVRLAIYDRHTPVLEKAKDGKRPRRKPHYVTARFSGGQVDGKALHILARNRLRLSGSLQIRFYRETLREVLVRSGNAGLLDGLGGCDPDEIYAVRDTVYMTVASAVVLASLGRKQVQAEMDV